MNHFSSLESLDVTLFVVASNLEEHWEEHVNSAVKSRSYRLARSSRCSSMEVNELKPYKLLYTFFWYSLGLSLRSVLKKCLPSKLFLDHQWFHGSPSYSAEHSPSGNSATSTRYPVLEDPRVALKFPDGPGQQGLEVHVSRVEDHSHDVDLPDHGIRSLTISILVLNSTSSP